MPHGTRRVGDVELVALCDGVVTASELATAFPGAASEAWAEARERYPGTFDGDRWRLHVHATLLRVGDRAILVDTGVGPATAPAFSWTGAPGALDRELEDAGVSPTDVRAVVITHVHDDHVGWNVDPATARPRFENARYLVHRADWDLMRTTEDEEDREIFAATLEPLERWGVLDVVEEPVELAGGVLVRHAPGHTPGHQVVWIDSRGELALIAGDLANHPVMLLQPGVNGQTDADPDLAWRTRSGILERVEREARLVVSSHFSDPFGRVAREGERYAWAVDPG